MDSTGSTGIESASPFASPSDALAISISGQYLEFVVKSAVSQAIFFGAYTILVFIAVHTLLARPSRQAQTLWLAAALVITYLCEVATISLSIASLLEFIRVTLISSNNINLPMGDRADVFSNWLHRAQADNVQLAVGNAGDAGLMFLITDALAIWRAMVVCRMSSRRALGSMMYLLLFVSLVFWLTTMILMSTNDELSRAGDRNISNVDLIAILPITSSVASIATNILATAVMGQAAWQYRLLQLKAGFRSEGARVLLFLTESGLLYVIIQIVRFALTLAVVPSTPAYGSLVDASVIFHTITRTMTAMYTPALIIIIQYGYSIADTIQAESTSVGEDHNSMGRGRRAGGRTLSALAFRRRTQGNSTGSDVTGHLSSGDMLGTSGSSVDKLGPVAEKTIARQNGVTVEV